MMKRLDQLVEDIAWAHVLWLPLSKHRARRQLPTIADWIETAESKFYLPVTVGDMSHFCYVEINEPHTSPTEMRS